MSYPSDVNVVVDGFAGDGQEMDYMTASNPPQYEKDLSDTNGYMHISFKRNSAGTNWDLIVYDNGKFFWGTRTPAADDPIGNYQDSGTQTATVQET